MLHKIIKGLAPIAAVALAAGLSGCNGAKVSVGDRDGVPLADLDMTGEAPTELVLAGPDTVSLARGERLAIDVGGDAEAVEALRFTLEDGSLGILREPGSGKIRGTAQVRVTMPPPDKIIVAGSGTIGAKDLASNAEILIAGSGRAQAKEIDSKSLEVTIAGSGTFTAAGNVEKLVLNVAGSGDAGMGALKAEKARITVAGSGDADFASDGTVDATIIGSGNVRVTGSAKCTIQSLGSGTLTCQSGTATGAGEDARAEAKATKKSAKSAKRESPRKGRKNSGPDLA